MLIRWGLAALAAIQERLDLLAALAAAGTS
jgi:hypothetical protein